MPSFAIESGAFEDEALREEAEDFQVPETAKPDLKLLEDERSAAKTPSTEFSKVQKDTIRDKVKTESAKETLESALDRFEAVNNEALKTELNELFDAINNRFRLDHEKTRGEKSAEAIKAWFAKIGEHEISYTLRNEVPPKKHSIRLGNLTTFLSGVAVGMAQSTVAKKILISATGIKGAAAAVIVGGTIGAIRGGMSANKSAEQAFYSAESWKQEVDRIEDPIEKLTIIESLLNNPEYAKYFKDKPEGALELLAEYQKIALAVDDEALTRLLKDPNNTDAMARWRALSEMKLYKNRKEDEKRAMIIKGVGRGAIRGAAWGLAGYGAFKLLGWMFHGVAVHAGTTGTGGETGAGSHSGDTNHTPTQPTSAHEGIPQDKPNLEWRHDGSTHGRLTLDSNQGRFVGAPDQTSDYSVKAQVTPEHIANSITHDILNSGYGTGSHAKFEMDPTQEAAFKGFLADYIKSHAHALGDHVRIPAEELNKALDFAHVKITPDTILDHSGEKYEFPSSAATAPAAPTGTTVPAVPPPGATLSGDPTAAVPGATQGPPIPVGGAGADAGGEIPVNAPPSIPHGSGEQIGMSALEKWGIAIGSVALGVTAAWLVERKTHTLGKYLERREEARQNKVDAFTKSLFDTIASGIKSMPTKEIVERLAESSKLIRKTNLQEVDKEQINPFLSEIGEALIGGGDFKEISTDYLQTVIAINISEKGNVYIDLDSGERYSPVSFLNNFDFDYSPPVHVDLGPPEGDDGDNTPTKLDDIFGPELEEDETPPPPAASPTAPAPQPSTPAPAVVAEPKPGPEPNYEIGGQSAREVNDQLYDAVARNNLDLARTISRAIQDKFANGYDLVMIGISGVKSKLTGFTEEDGIITQYQMQSEENPEDNFPENQRGIQRESRSFDFEERTAPTPDIQRNAELMAEFSKYQDYPESLFITSERYRNFALINKGVFTSFKASETDPGSYIAKSIMPGSKDAAWTPEKNYNVKEFLKLVDDLLKANYEIFVDPNSKISIKPEAASNGSV